MGGIKDLFGVQKNIVYLFEELGDRGKVRNLLLEVCAKVIRYLMYAYFSLFVHSHSKFVKCNVNQVEKRLQPLPEILVLLLDYCVENLNTKSVAANSQTKTYFAARSLGVIEAPV